MNIDDRFGFGAGIVMMIMGLTVITIPFQIFGEYQFGLIGEQMITLLTVGVGVVFTIMGYKVIRMNLK